MPDTHLGEPKTKWVEKIPEWLNLLAERKKLILAGKVPAIPENHKSKLAVGGFSLAARMIMNSSKQLYEENLLSEASNGTVQARYKKVSDLVDIVKAGMDSPEIDRETIQQSLDRLCLILTSFKSLDQLLIKDEE